VDQLSWNVPEFRYPLTDVISGAVEAFALRNRIENAEVGLWVRSRRSSPLRAPVVAGGVAVYQAIASRFFPSEWDARLRWNGLRRRARTCLALDQDLPMNFSIALTKQNSECWCISLSAHRERRQRFAKLAKQFSSEVSFWDAEDCRNLGIKDYPQWVSREVRIDHDKSLTPGEVGLAWSTKKLYEYALKKGIKYLIVLEDDTTIQKEPDLRVKECFDYIFFNDFIMKSMNGAASPVAPMDISFHEGECKTFLQYISNGKQLKLPIDLLLIAQSKSMMDWGHSLCRVHDESLPTLECYNVGPYVFNNQDFGSTTKVAAKDAPA